MRVSQWPRLFVVVTNSANRGLQISVIIGTSLPESQTDSSRQSGTISKLTSTTSLMVRCSVHCAYQLLQLQPTAHCLSVTPWGQPYWLFVKLVSAVRVLQQVVIVVTAITDIYMLTHVLTVWVMFNLFRHRVILRWAYGNRLGRFSLDSHSWCRASELHDCYSCLSLLR